MPRKPSDKPWLHAKSGFWCTTFHGRREYLDKDYRAACKKLDALRKKIQAGEPQGRDWLDASFAELADEYLADLKARKKLGTYTAVRYRLLPALKVLGTKLRVGEIRKLHLAQVERKLTEEYSPTTLKDILAAVQGVMYWAVKLDMIETNPLARYEKPAARCRTRVATPEEFRALLRHADPHFRRFLIALRETGCRPGELRTLTWDSVDLSRALWIIPEHKTITRQRDPRPRMIPLPVPILKMCHWLARHSHISNDHVFINRFGRAYTKDCLVKKMARLRSRAGIEAKGGEQFVLYTHRHSFGTEGAGKVSDLELAELMGHTDVRMTRRYVHLNVDRLHDIQRRRRG
jgi:integrase